MKNSQKGNIMELEDIFPKDKIRNLPDSDWRHRMMFDAKPEVSEIRGCVIRLLSFAERQGIVDNEMLSRLGSDDYEQFRSAIHELAVAEFLSPIGNINWHPPGRNLRVGEFEIKPTNHEPIFVEVKTIFKSPDEQREERNWDVLREIAHNIPSPFRIWVEFLKLQHEVVPRHFRPWLKWQISDLREELTDLYQERELIFADTFDDGSVIEVKVKFVRIESDGLPTACDLWCGVRQVELHERVKEVIDGALEQLPDNQPTLVVVASTAWVGLDKVGMLAAMFSFPKVTFTRGTAMNKQELSVHYDLEGIVQPSIRTRLSAAGVWHHKWTKEPQGSLDVYHNPLGARQIPYHVLELPNVCQLVPKGKSTMEWTPNRPSE